MFGPFLTLYPTMEKDVPDSLYYNPAEYDKLGKALLSAFLGFDDVSDNPVSINNFMAFLHYKKYLPLLMIRQNGGITLICKTRLQHL